MKTALVTGISGQDGAYLAQLLLAKGYRVVGTTRTGSAVRPARLVELGVLQDLEVVPFAPGGVADVLRLLERVRPDEVYNLAARSFVGDAWDAPVPAFESSASSAMLWLEALRTGFPGTRFYQASTSELFGDTRVSPQREDTPFRPRNPYGIGKLAAHWATVNYRERFGLHASCGLLFNHESPLRESRFLTRKVALGIAGIALGGSARLEVGNLDARRDWGYAPEYVEGMWMMLQQERASDYVLATGVLTTIRDFISHAATAAGIALDWRGRDDGETAVDARSGRIVACVNPAFFRPAEQGALVGDPAMASERLGWRARTGVRELARLMVEADLRRTREAALAY